MIKLGYEVGTGEEVYIKNSHIIVTGLTQEAKSEEIEQVYNHILMEMLQ